MTLSDSRSELQQAVSQGGLSVIDMSNDGEIPDFLRRVVSQVYMFLFSAAVLARMRTKCA